MEIMGLGGRDEAGGESFDEKMLDIRFFLTSVAEPAAPLARSVPVGT